VDGVDHLPHVERAIRHREHLVWHGRRARDQGDRRARGRAPQLWRRLREGLGDGSGGRLELESRKRQNGLRAYARIRISGQLGERVGLAAQAQGASRESRSGPRQRAGIGALQQLAHLRHRARIAEPAQAQNCQGTQVAAVASRKLFERQK
jgi:hypothetical protein